MTDMSNSGAELRSYIDRIRNLHEVRKDIASDIRDLFSEARSGGFDVKAIKAVIKYLDEDRSARAEHDAIVTTYLNALGEA